MSICLPAFERCRAIYNAVVDLHARSIEGKRIDSRLAWQLMQERFPDITKIEFLRAASTFSRVSAILCAHAEDGEGVFSAEIENEIEAVIAAYAKGDPIWSH